ncbi:MAG: lysylphosphatidylglycerol synthase transmembrane domain-containing protein [bacterium]
MIKKSLHTLLKLIISFALIVFLIKRIGISSIIEVISSVSLVWIGLALCIFLVSHCIGSYQWWLLLQAEKIKINFFNALKFYFVGLFFNNFLPSSLGGDLFRMFDINKFSSKGTSAVFSVIIDRFMGFFVLSCFAVLAFPVIILENLFDQQYITYFLIFIGIWVFILFLFFNKKVAQPFAWVYEKLAPEEIHLKTIEVYRKIHSFGRSRSLFIKLVFISILIQSLRIFMHYMVSRSLDVNVSCKYFFFIIPFIAIISSLPISIGGIGIRESIGMILFSSIAAIQNDVAVSIEFLAFLVAIFSSLPGGIIFIIRRKINKKNE